jgi:hypothetical protein
MLKRCGDSDCRAMTHTAPFVKSFLKEIEDRIHKRLTYVRVENGIVQTRITLIRRVPHAGQPIEDLCGTLKGEIEEALKAKFPGRAVQVSVSNVSLHENSCEELGPVSCALNLACGCLPFLCGGACIWLASLRDRREPPLYFTVTFLKKRGLNAVTPL